MPSRSHLFLGTLEVFGPSFVPRSCKCFVQRRTIGTMKMHNKRNRVELWGDKPGQSGNMQGAKPQTSDLHQGLLEGEITHR